MTASRLDSQTLAHAVALVRAWEDRWGAVEPHPALVISATDAEKLLALYVERLHDNYPFFHPRYAGQMLKPPHPIAVAGYLAAMLINPNNHALDGGPATGEMEKEVVRELASLFDLPENALGHLTTSGTIANLEALWIGREIHPDKRVLISDQAHYTHARMGELLRIRVDAVPSDPFGRMRAEAVEDALRKGDVGTVVATAGTTGLGAVDPIADLAELTSQYGARLHVDAAYGGFYRLLALEPDALQAETTRHLLAMRGADSVVVDPHKHGLQPYGCGCVLFRDAAVGRFYKHDSPYTYFTSDALHLGEISLECSRAGAAAGALWLTLQALPLSVDGLGAALSACRRAALDFHERLSASDVLRPVLRPELDIVAFFLRHARSAAAVDELSAELMRKGMSDSTNPVFLSLLRLDPHLIGYAAEDARPVRVLRSVLMKPEHEGWTHRLIERIELLAHAVMDASHGDDGGSRESSR